MEFNVSSASYEHRIDVTEKILSNMQNQQQKLGTTGILLAGDPGTGKTSFIKFFALLTGIELITIEAPHITEEHIINIPFIMFNPITNATQQGVTHVKAGADYKIILSDSNLFSQIKRAKPISDAEYLKKIYSSPHDIIKIFEELGGDKDTVPDLIEEIRKHYKVVLFLDEYFRTTSVQIRNMLRGILNGKIGTHEIPSDTYVIYASNMNDEGGSVEDVPLNSDFLTVNFESPNKEDWFAYLISKFKEDEKVTLNKKIIDKFYTLLDDESLNFNDMGKMVRTSPRRWEQLILYINSSLPAESEDDAKGLMTNVKANFKNYLTGEHSELADKVLHAVSELIKDTSGFDVGSGDVHGNEDWRKTLEHQIKQKMKLGHHRKYIPIISGLPGIGKTSRAVTLAVDMDLGYIYIDCSLLSAEDVTGIPLAKTGDGTVETSFSESKLYKQIISDKEAIDKNILNQFKKKYKDEKEAEEAFKKWQSSEWKYLVFFDELNRTKTKVFNGIRKVLLEKEFGDGNSLPPESVVIAAINPHDVGTSELTQHMRDVVDIIDSNASWSSTKSFIESRDFPHLSNDTIKDVVYTTLLRFVDKFKVKVTEGNMTKDEKNFYLNVGATPAYVSPREYSNLFTNAVTYTDNKISRLIKKIDWENITADESQALLLKFKKAIFHSFESTLTNIFHKQHIDSPSFIHDLQQWMLTTDDIDFGDGIFTKKAGTANFESFIRPYWEDPNLNLVDEMAFINYIGNADSVKFKEDMVEFLMSEIQKDEDIVDKVIAKKHQKKVLDGDKIKFEKEEVSKLENFIREVVHSLKVHKLSNDKVEMVLMAFREFIGKIPKDDEYFDDLLSFNKSMRNFLKNI